MRPSSKVAKAVRVFVMALPPFDMPVKSPSVTLSWCCSNTGSRTPAMLSARVLTRTVAVLTLCCTEYLQQQWETKV